MFPHHALSVHDVENRVGAEIQAEHMQVSSCVLCTARTEVRRKQRQLEKDIRELSEELRKSREAELRNVKHGEFVSA